MVGIAQHVPLFTKMVDRLAPISAELASAFKAAGIGVVGRYLETLTPYERDNLFEVGLGILPLSKAPPQPLSAAFGRARAEELLQKASLLGVPAGVHLMIDLEAQQGDHTDVVGYDSELSTEIARIGYIPLAYIGADQRLSSAELFTLPDIHLYWRGGSLGIPEPACGFAIWQIPPLEQQVCGSIVDMSLTGADLRGRRPIFWYPD